MLMYLNLFLIVNTNCYFSVVSAGPRERLIDSMHLSLASASGFTQAVVVTSDSYYYFLKSDHLCFLFSSI